MNRRHFLGTAALGLSAVGPVWLRQAFAAGKQCAVDEESELAAVSRGYRAAQRAGRPLLCLIVPTADAAKWTRGRAFGELLNHGKDDELAPLALCEVICCRMAALVRLVPAVGAGEPLMVLVDTASLPADGLRLDAELAKDEDRGRGFAGKSEADWRRSYEEQKRREEASVQRRIATLSRLLREAVAKDEAMLQRRLDEQRPHRKEPLPEGPDKRAQLIGLLASEARARLVKGRVPGSRWARSAGCGTTIEGEQDNMVVGCGMGHVPEKSARFLYFFSQTPSESMAARAKGEPCSDIF